MNRGCALLAAEHLVPIRSNLKPPCRYLLALYLCIFEASISTPRRRGLEDMRGHNDYHRRDDLLDFEMLDWCPSDHNHVDSIPQIGLWRRKPGHRRHMRMEETEIGRMESGHDRNRQTNRSDNAILYTTMPRRQQSSQRAACFFRPYRMASGCFPCSSLCKLELWLPDRCFVVFPLSLR